GDCTCPNRRGAECRRQSRFALPRGVRAELMGFKKTFLNVAGVSVVATTLMLAGERPSLDADASDALAENSAVLQNTPAPQAATNTLSATKNATMGTVSAAPKPTPSQNVTINLIHRLVERGVLTQADADELIHQAEEDAASARALAAKQTKPEPA